MLHLWLRINWKSKGKTKMKSLRTKKINILLTAIIICVSIVALSLTYIPILMGYKMFAVKTGSMAPEIESGSVVFVEPCRKFEDYSVGDIVTFTDNETNRSFTHRIALIDESNRTFKTKGDANKDEDPSPTSFEKAVGTVVFTFPYVGKAVEVINSTLGKIVIAVVYISWAAIEIEIFLSERRKRYD